MGVPRSLHPTNGAAQRQQRCRPTLEVLEDRHLLAAGFGLVNLASDVPGLARTTDPNVVNPWGLAFSPTGPFWLADNGSSVSDIIDGAGGPFALVVPVPSGSAPTGVVFNGGSGFVISENGVAAPGRFLFVTEAGTIAAWTAVVDPARALLAVDNSTAGAVYTGVAVATTAAGRDLLYVADFGRATVDVFDQRFQPVTRAGAFQDPNLPDGFAPFNIQDIDNLLFVTYAERDANGHDDVPGAGHGYIDVYNTDGSLLRRFASEGPLDSPWGLALAPSKFGAFGGDLLVGNNGDGHISAYDPQSGVLRGQLAGDNAAPIAIPYLWALSFGNGHVGGDSGTLFFAAGVDDSAHGIFGAIQAPTRRGADTAGSGVFDPHAPGEPGDYPLPPRAGPALNPDSAVRPNPVVDLVPLTPSSLVLVPTLSPAALASTRSDTLTTFAIPDAAAFPSGDDGSQPVPSADGHVFAWSALFDLSAVPARHRNVAAGEFSFEGNIVAPTAEAHAQQDARLSLVTGEASGALPQLASPRDAAATAPGAGQHEHAQPRHGSIHAWLIGLLALIGGPMALLCSARRDAGLRWPHWIRRSDREGGRMKQTINPTR
jgi:uncharacterized protein (TIGR03118 family)